MTWRQHSHSHSANLLGSQKQDASILITADITHKKGQPCFKTEYPCKSTFPMNRFCWQFVVHGQAWQSLYRPGVERDVGLKQTTAKESDYGCQPDKITYARHHQIPALIRGKAPVNNNQTCLHAHTHAYNLHTHTDTQTYTHTLRYLRRISKWD